MEIPYYILLYIYLGLVGLFLILSFFDLFHVVRFGFLDGTSAFVMFVFIAVSALILFVSYTELRKIDWSEVIVLNLPFNLS